MQSSSPLFEAFKREFEAEVTERHSPTLMQATKAFFLSTPDAPSEGLAYLKSFDGLPSKWDNDKITMGHKASGLAYRVGLMTELPVATRLAALLQSVNTTLNGHSTFDEVPFALLEVSRDPALSEDKRYEALGAAIARSVGAAGLSQAAHEARKAAIKAKDPGLRGKFLNLASLTQSARDNGPRADLHQRILAESRIPRPKLPGSLARA
jgi:hypothetical protein